MFKKNLLSESSNISTEKNPKKKTTNLTQQIRFPSATHTHHFQMSNTIPCCHRHPQTSPLGEAPRNDCLMLLGWFSGWESWIFFPGRFWKFGGRKNIRKTHNRLQHHKQAWLRINSLHQSSRKSMQIVSVPAFSATSTRVFSSAGGKEKTFPKEMRSVAPLWCCLRQGSIFLRSSISVHSVLPSSYFLRQKIGSFWRWRISC